MVWVSLACNAGKAAASSSRSDGTPAVQAGVSHIYVHEYASFPLI